MKNAEPRALVIVLVVCLAALGSSGCTSRPDFVITGDTNSVTVDNRTEEFFFTIQAKDELVDARINYQPNDNETGELLNFTQLFHKFGDITEGDSRLFSTEVEVLNSNGSLVEQINFHFGVSTDNYHGTMSRSVRYVRSSETNGSRYTLLI